MWIWAYLKLCVRILVFLVFVYSLFAVKSYPLWPFPYSIHENIAAVFLLITNRRIYQKYMCMFFLPHFFFVCVYDIYLFDLLGDCYAWSALFIESI